MLRGEKGKSFRRSMKCYKDIKAHSEKIVRRALTYIGLSLTRCRVKLQESVLHEFVYLHDGCLITASITVVWCREYCNNVALMSPVVSVHHKLMGTWDQLEAISMVELLWDVLTKRIASTSWGDTPTAAIIRVRPQQVAYGALVRNFLHSIELTDLVKSVDRWGETSMETEYLTFHNRSQGQVVEKLSERLPNISVAVLS